MSGDASGELPPAFIREFRKGCIKRPRPLPLSDTLHRPEYLRGYIKTEKEEEDTDVLVAIDQSVNVPNITFGHVKDQMEAEPRILELGPLEMPDVPVVMA